jgi:uncharacterized RDD family membrane protein YckC
MSDRDPLDPLSQDPQPPGDPAPAPSYVPPAPTPPPTSAKPDVAKRAIAAIIDGAIAGIIGRFVPYVGWIASLLYILLRDGFEFDFMDGRSIGKKLMGLRPVRQDGQKMDFATSIRRNWTLCLGSLATFLLVIPVLGWILYFPTIIAAAVLGIIELVRVFTDPEGRRLGDTMAGTKVIESPD